MVGRSFLVHQCGKILLVQERGRWAGCIFCGGEAWDILALVGHSDGLVG